MISKHHVEVEKWSSHKNVMWIYDFNILFIYVYLGWQNNAHDSNIILDALDNQDANFPYPVEGDIPLSNRIVIH